MADMTPATIREILSALRWRLPDAIAQRMIEDLEQRLSRLGVELDEPGEVAGA